MNPDKLQQLEERITKLERCENPSFLKLLARLLLANMSAADLPPIKLSDLSDVEDTDDATTGEVLKKTATTWQPGTDNTA